MKVKQFMCIACFQKVPKLLLITKKQQQNPICNRPNCFSQAIDRNLLK
jgi:hypothetical protein